MTRSSPVSPGPVVPPLSRKGWITPVTPNDGNVITAVFRRRISCALPPFFAGS